MKRQPGKQPKEVAEKTKNKILKAALRVFAREGFFKAKLREISSIAGTTHSLIRHHFGSKEDLWTAVVEYGLKLHEAGLKKAIDSQTSSDPVECFKNIIRTHIDIVAHNLELSQMLLHDVRRHSLKYDFVAEKQKRIHDLAEPFFKGAQACGYFKGFNHDSFSVYMKAIADTPIISWDLSNHLLKADIRSEKGIALHTERVIEILFRKNG